MNRAASCLLVLVSSGLLGAGCSSGDPEASRSHSERTAAPTEGAAASTGGAAGEWRQPLFEGLGDLHIPITTSSDTAQRYFDQGLSLAFAFNHAAADLAFNEAVMNDPDCAMCYWGSALVLGPNVNHGSGQRRAGP